MANAGRVAIVPKGEYSATVAYKRLDLVRYNNDLYIAKKANTGVTPTDSETWMLSLENVSQTQYDDIINGTTAVGNALKLNGLTAEEFREKTKTTITTLPTPTEECDYMVYGGDSTFPYPYGLLEIRYGTEPNEYTAKFQTSAGENSLYIAKHKGSWSGWKHSADGGNADTVNGVRVYKSFAEIGSTVSKNTPILDLVTAMADYSKLTATVYMGSTDVYPVINGTLEIEKSAGNSTYTALAFTERSGNRKWHGTVQPNASYWSGWLNDADGGNADTVDGYHASDFVKTSGGDISSLKILAENPSASEGGQLVLEKTPNSNLVGDVVIDNHSNNVRIYENGGDFRGANINLTECSNVDGVRIIHTDNMKNYVLPLDGSVPMSGADLWLYNGSGKVSCDGTATSMYVQNDNDSSNRRLLRLMNKTSKDNVGSALQLFDKVDGVDKSYDILHTGNSQKVVTSASAPSDTSALWYDTTNKILKRYVDGAWQA